MIESKHNPLGSLIQFLDPYSRQARLYPALIVICPIALLILVWFPALWTTFGAIVSVASSFGLVLLLAQIARDRGKTREGELYKSWGGKPSVALLRYADQRIDEQTKDRYRAFLKAKLPQLALPTRDEEQARPAEADRAYESVTAWLLTQTRDTKTFSILFRENVSFGFRRNLWGLKSIGIAVAAIAGSASLAVILYRYWVEQRTPSPEIAIVTIAVWVLVLIWVALITPSWVRVPADAYGMQLLAACDTLSTVDSAKPRKSARESRK